MKKISLKLPFLGNFREQCSEPRPSAAKEYAHKNHNQVTCKQDNSTDKQPSQQIPQKLSEEPNRHAEDATKKAEDHPEQEKGRCASWFKAIRNTITVVWLCLTLILALLDRLLPSPAVPSPDGASAPTGTQYAQPLSMVHDPSDGRITEYVLAFDNSGSMSDSLEKRNAAMNAIIRGLPRDRTHVTAFPFSGKSQGGLQDILPMSEEKFRKIIESVVEKSGDAKGGTNLGLMMEMAIGRFSDQSLDNSKRHILYVITDGWSDGDTEEIAKARDQKFFSMCEEYREKVDVYVILVSEDGEVLQNLCTGLNTQQVELSDSSTNTLLSSKNQLIEWEDGDDGRRKEYAKVLSIPDLDMLETALLLLQYANTDMDSVFFRTAEENTVVSFPIPALCTQKLTIALSGGASVKETLSDLKWENGKTDLLQDAVIGDDPSVVTIYDADGLQPGLYTMKIKTDTKLSAVFSYQNNYMVRYALKNLDNPVLPPAGSEAVLQMQLLRPDGTPLAENAAVALSMRVECLEGANPADTYCELNNQEQLSFANLGVGDRLRFYPVVICSGVREKIDSFWDVQLSEPPAPEEPPEQDPSNEWHDSILPRMWKLSAALAAVVALLWLYTAIKYGCNKAEKRRSAEEQRQKELRLTDDFTCAGICWRLSGSGGLSCIGSFGLTDDNGHFHSGCDLSEVLVWTLKKSTLVRRRNPLKFCLWRYSPDRRCTELVLRTDRRTAVVDKEDNLLHHQIAESSRSTLVCFGVDAEHRSGTVEIKTPVLQGEFRLEYYDRK